MSNHAINASDFSQLWQTAKLGYASDVLTPYDPSSGQTFSKYQDNYKAILVANNFDPLVADAFVDRYQVVTTSNIVFAGLEPYGYQSVLFLDTLTNTYIIATAGVTDDELGQSIAGNRDVGFNYLQYQAHRVFADFVINLKVANNIINPIQLTGHSLGFQLNYVLLADLDLDPATQGLIGAVTGFGGLGFNPTPGPFSGLGTVTTTHFDEILQHIVANYNDPNSLLFSNVFNLQFGNDIVPDAYTQIGLQLHYAGGYSYPLFEEAPDVPLQVQLGFVLGVTINGLWENHSQEYIDVGMGLAVNNSLSTGYLPPAFDYSSLGLPANAFTGELQLTGPAAQLLVAGNTSLGGLSSFNTFGVSLTQTDPVTGNVTSQHLTFSEDVSQLLSLTTYSFDDATQQATFNLYEYSAEEIKALNAEQAALGEELGVFNSIPLMSFGLDLSGATTPTPEDLEILGEEISQQALAGFLPSVQASVNAIVQSLRNESDLLRGLLSIANDPWYEEIFGETDYVVSVSLGDAALGIPPEVTTFDTSGRKIVTKYIFGSEGLVGYVTETHTGGAIIHETFEYVDGVIVEVSQQVEIDGAILTFANIGGVLGSTLARQLVPNNVAAQVVVESLLGTLLTNVGQALDLAPFVGANAVSDDIFDEFNNLGDELAANILSNGVGALSSFLLAQFVDVLGLEGVLGGIVQNAGTATITTLVSNLQIMALEAADETLIPLLADGVTPDPTTPFKNIGTQFIPSAVGSFLGTTLANELVSANTNAGQLGAAIAGSLGSIAGSVIAASIIASASTAAAAGTGVAIGVVAQIGLNFALPFVGALIGVLLGTLIGDLFGTTPKTSADLTYDPETGEFGIANLMAEGGASKNVARNMTLTAANQLGGVIDMIGGAVGNSDELSLGSLGMYQTSFSYWEDGADGTRQDFSDFGDAIEASVFDALGQIEIVGGDTFIKRALYNGLELTAVANNIDVEFIDDGEIGDLNFGQIRNATGTNWDLTTMLGDLQVGQDYSFYRENSFAINTLIGNDPTSAFAATWIITLARAAELGLNKRHVSDWYGGWDFFLDQANTVAGNVAFGFSGKERVFQYLDIDGQVQLIKDTIDSGAKDIITGTAGADNITVIGDILQGNTALDINGTTGSATNYTIDVAAQIYGGDGNDTITGGDLGNELYGEGGDDTLTGGRNADWLFGGDGNDTLNAGFGDGNLLVGGAGDDVLNGGDGSDWLEGGDGIDQLYGGAGGDILASGAGNETVIEGGSGNDQYIFRAGDGQDVIFDEGAIQGGGGTVDVQQTFLNREGGIEEIIWTRGAQLADGTSLLEGTEVSGGEDAIVFGPGILMEDIRITRPTGTDDLFIEIYKNDVATGDTLTVTDWYNDFNRIEKLIFSDGQVIDISDTVSFVVGTSGDDVLLGTNGNDFIVGGAGNDTITLFDGNDFGNGSTGDDLVSGDNGDDLVLGADGDDVVSGNAGKDTVLGGRGNDEVSGGAGDDILVGGEGDDMIVTGDGNDIVKFDRGDGHDVVVDTYANWVTVWTAAGGFETGYQRENSIEITGPTGEVLYDGQQWLVPIEYDKTAGVIMVSTDGVTGNDGDDRIEFDLGIDVHDIYFENVGNDLVIGVAPAGADVNFGDISDTITLKDFELVRGIESLSFFNLGSLNIGEITGGNPDGIDMIGGGTDGDDTINGTANRDWLTGNAGDDTILGNGGDDLLNGNGGSDTIRGGDGDDVILAGSGNDILEGGLGSDILFGDSGFDTVSFEGSSGDVLVHLSGYFNNLQFPISGIDGDTLISIEGVIGSAFDDKIYGLNTANQFEGGAGDDVIYGGAGDDIYTFNIGDGVDVIHDKVLQVNGETFEAILNSDGSAVPPYVIDIQWFFDGEFNTWSYDKTITDTATPQEVYNYSGEGFSEQVADPGTFSAGWDPTLNIGGSNGQTGIVTLASETTTTGNAGNDTIILGDGLGLSDINFTLNGNDLTIGLIGTTDSITISDFTLTDSQIETLAFSNGVSVNLTGITLDGTSTAGDDFMVGTTGDDIYSAGDGADTLSGMLGDDTLTGGLGDDQISGGAGADAIDGGDGVDTAIYNGSNAGITIDLTAGTGLGGDAQGDTLTSIENVIGSDFDDTITGDANDNQLIGGKGDDMLFGLDGDDVLIGGEGNDTLTGGLGDDNIDGGSGNDTLDGGDGHDMLNAGDGVDDLTGGLGDDWLIAGAGNDTLSGGAGLDKLIAGDGDDILTGGADDDELTGGAGNDTLTGGTGADAYVFSLNSGVDTLNDDGLDENIIVFDNTVSHEQLWFKQNGNDLEIYAIGGDTKVTITGWFLDTSNPPVKAIHTLTGSIHFSFIQNVLDVQALETFPATVDDIPQTVIDAIGTYWYQGENPAPSADDAALNVDENNEPATTNSVNGQVTNVLDLDDNLLALGLYSVQTEPGNGTVTIDADTGAYTYTPDTFFEGTDTFQVGIEDADGSIGLSTVTVTVNPIATSPQDVTSLPSSFDENGSQLLVGTLSGNDPDVGDSHTFEILAGLDGADFAIIGSQLWFVGNARNFEVDTDLTLNVRATDSTSLSVDKVVTVSINDVGETPTGLAFTGNVAEAAAAGTAVGTASATDVDGGASITYSLAFDGDGAFTIDPNTGAVTVAAGGNVDFEGGSNHITIVATGSSGGVSRETFTITVTDADEAPIDIDFESGLIDGATVGTVVGTAVAIDEDDGDTHTYELSDDAGGTFVIDANNGEVSVATGVTLDLATTPTYNITIKVIDADDASLFYEEIFTMSEGSSGPPPTTSIDGTSAADTLNGTSGDDFIYGFEGDDTLNGNAGDDMLVGGAGGDEIDGGSGTDFAIYGSSPSAIDVSIDDNNSSNNGATGGDAAGDWFDNVEGIIGSDFADTLEGDNGSQEILVGGQGDDDIDGRTGDDILSGGAGADTIFGDNNDDIIFGGDGDDNIDGHRHNDTLYGGAGNDTIVGGHDDDHITGGLGDDDLQGGDDLDTYYFSANSGSDTITDDDKEDNTIVFDASVSLNDLWFTEVGNGTLKIEVIGGDTVITINDGLDDEIITFFKTVDGDLHYDDVQALVTAMDGISLPTSVANIPAGVQTAIDANWVDSTSTTPYAYNATVTVLENHDLLATNSVSGTLSGVTDPDSNILGTGAYSVQSGPYFGTVTVNADTGAYTYTPDLNYSGSDVFQIGIEDASSNIGLVGITVEVTAQAYDAAPTPSGGGTNAGPNVGPLTLDFSGVVVDEDEAVGFVVGTATATDPNSADTLTFSLVDDAGGLFAIDAAGVVTVNGALDFEALSSHTITIRVTDDAGLTKDRSFPIFLNEIGESPNAINFVGSLDENTGALTNLGIFIAADDEGGPFTYSLENDPSGKFAIDTSSGVVSTTAGVSFDYETTASYDVTVKATDAQGNFYQEIITLNVGNINEDVTAVNFTGTAIDENLPAGTVVGTASAVDDDTSDTHTFTITNDPSGYFTIDATTGVVTLATGADIDYEVAASHDITIRATDAGGLFKEQIFTVAVNDLIEGNTPPTIGDATFSIQENAPLFTPIGTVTASDPDDPNSPEGTLTYTIESGNSLQKFAINASTGAIEVNGGLNFEADPLIYNLVVRVTDGVGTFDDAAITINMTDVNETPVATDKNKNILFGSTPGLIINLNASDPDGDALIYTITGVTGSGSTSDFYVSGGKLYSSSNFNHMSIERESTVTVNVSDGLLSVNQTVDITWLTNGEGGQPVVFDLDGDGVELVSSIGSTLQFDINGDGYLDTIGWVAPDDGFLVLDRNGDGIVTDGTEISFVDDLPGAETDLEGLAAFDTNGDGILDAADQRFAEFLVWQDINQNGFSEADELKTLSEAGITSINLTLTPTGETVEGASDNVIVNTAEYTKSDGTTGIVGDVTLFYSDGAPGQSGGHRQDRVRNVGAFIEAQVAANNGNGNGVTPVILDLDGDGVELVGLSESQVYIDADDDNLLERVGWVAPDDGILVYDANGNGRVEVIGEISFVDYVEGAQTDLEGLAFFDTNNDGVLDASDDNFASFGVWQDLDQDGKSDPGEFRSLQDAGISGINLTPTPVGTTLDGNTIHNSGTFIYSDGTVGVLADVELGFEDVNIPKFLGNFMNNHNPRLAEFRDRVIERFGIGGHIFGEARWGRNHIPTQVAQQPSQTAAEELQSSTSHNFQKLIQAMATFGADRGGELDLQERRDHFQQHNFLGVNHPNFGG